MNSQYKKQGFLFFLILASAILTQSCYYFYTTEFVYKPNQQTFRNWSLETYVSKVHIDGYAPGEVDTTWDVWFIASVSEEPAPITKLVIDSMRYVLSGKERKLLLPNMYDFEHRGGNPRAEAYFGEIPIKNILPTTMNLKLFMHIEEYETGKFIADSSVFFQGIYKKHSPKILK